MLQKLYLICSLFFIPIRHGYYLRSEGIEQSPNSKFLWSINEVVVRNEEEQGDHFEGDMILSAEQLAALSLRNGLTEDEYLWPNRTVFYTITEDFNEDHRIYIRSALDEIESVTCLKFVPRINEAAYVKVQVS